MQRTLSTTEKEYVLKIYEAMRQFREDTDTGYADALNSVLARLMQAHPSHNFPDFTIAQRSGRPGWCTVCDCYVTQFEASLMCKVSVLDAAEAAEREMAAANKPAEVDWFELNKSVSGA